MNYCGNLEIDRCHHLIRHLDNSHLYTQLMKIFRHLQSDKTSSDDNGFLHFLTAGPRFVSATFRRVKIPSVRIPSQGGSTGSAPGDNTNLSNDSRYVFPVAQSFITTCLFSGSIAFTSDFIRTSILKRALKLSGVCTNKRSLSSITPPI